MGQKVNPIGFRLGVIRTWDSKWFFNKKVYPEMVYEDHLIRTMLKRRWANASISRVEIERPADLVKVTIHTARPGAVIGRGGKGIDEINQAVERTVHKRHKDARVYVNVAEVQKPEMDAQLVAESIAAQIEKRVSHRRAMRQAVMRATRQGVRGIKVICSGRLGGSEMARRETEKAGKVPLHTLRADVDYGYCVAKTIYGAVGCRVWIYRGEVFQERARRRDDLLDAPGHGSGDRERRARRPRRTAEEPAGE
ncbi:MAG: 30S ribosomal protein S3 [Fimbriimonadales bacterium]